jgi:hypothetical protein
MQGAGAAASTLGDLCKLCGPFGQCAAEFVGVVADLGVMMTLIASSQSVCCDIYSWQTLARFPLIWLDWFTAAKR